MNKKQIISQTATVAAALAILVALGCSSIEPAIQSGLDARQQYEQRKADEKAEKERLRLAEEQAARDRVAAEAAAKEEEEAKQRAQYAEGPSTPEHGRRGFIWKPISDNTGKPVVILPPRFSHKTRRLTVNGERIALDKIANGYREHYRMWQHYTNLVTVQAEASDGEGGAWYRWTWIVSDPSQRNDSTITPRKDAL